MLTNEDTVMTKIRFCDGRHFVFADRLLHGSERKLPEAADELRYKAARQFAIGMFLFFYVVFLLHEASLGGCFSSYCFNWQHHHVPAGQVCLFPQHKGGHKNLEDWIIDFCTFELVTEMTLKIQKKIEEIGLLVTLHYVHAIKH